MNAKIDTQKSGKSSLATSKKNKYVPTRTTPAELEALVKTLGRSVKK